ncbi:MULTISPECIES: UDP-N-acetylmuramoyl-tripeptide--D-alanyl-D-alanine ligase [unclassified Alteromonas]|uniref:UDP-N-acetylmuramoyl-tripeptide--D-alanyl-D- alanine ligase n=1 Tax=unclassified Alteromonas TaxID=2614992 RepID=UPI000509BA3E|nr:MULTISPECIES: UDP-N-acetylmuramoyl-tripeptide--D-alanyl-D-alanine ligase [unclassified Alteromonas]
MIITTLSWVAEKINGTLIGNDCDVSNVSTDTRIISEGAIYLALKGPNFNGHDFVNQAQRAGAKAIIASEDITTSLPVIQVSDTKVALGLLGAAVKASVAPKTIAITGSSGKTTVKEMCASILQGCGSVLATKGNFNNDIGVPLTLLRLEPHHDFAVMELGANHKGEIAYTTELVKPDVATIVNAAASHLEGFGSVDGVARAKSEIFDGLGNNGVAIVNIDSEFGDFWLDKVSGKQTLTFSPDQKNAADFTATDIEIKDSGCASFTLNTPKGHIAIALTIPGIHNVGNALLAAALTLNVGATLADVSAGLSAMNQVDGRLNVKRLNKQLRVLDDTYNANVASVKAAINTLGEFSGAKVFILGDMAELGDESDYYHQHVGEYAKQQGINYLYTMGALSHLASESFGGRHFDNLDSLLASLQDDVVTAHQDISILVKGSRSSKMERVVKAIEASSFGQCDSNEEQSKC